MKEVPRASRRQQQLLAIALGSCLAAVLHAQDPAGWREAGRPLPRPEANRPALDPDLPAYRPCLRVAESEIYGIVPTILPDLVGRWTAGFRLRQPGIRIAVPPPYGAPQGSLNPSLQAFLNGSGDLAFLPRAMSLADQATFRRAHGHEPVVVPVAGGSFRHFGFVDPVVVVVNDANPTEQLSNEELKRLFAGSVAATARPVSWADLGVAGWSDRPIKVVGGAQWSEADSARGLVVRQRLLAGDSLRVDLGSESGTEAEVPARVAADPDAIGFTGLGHLRDGTHALSIADEAGNYVAPSLANVSTARYPLARTVDLVIATAPGKQPDPAVAEFIRFLLSRDAQSIVLEQGIFLPLTAAQVHAALEKLGTDVVATCGGIEPAAVPGRSGF